MLSEKIRFNGWQQNELVGDFYRGSSEIGILFCHGLASSRWEFSDFPEKLAERGYKVFAFDCSGHGESQGIKSLFTAQNHLVDTKNALDILKDAGAQKIIILGHSLGAHAALLGLKEKNVAAAILACPSRKSGDNLSFDKKIAVWLIGNFYRFFGDFIKRDIYLKLGGDQTSKINIRFLAYALKINNMELAAKTTKPILFIAAKEDKDVPMKKSLSLYEKFNFPKKLLVLENSGHEIFDGQDKELLLDEIDKFTKTIL
ncbi:MAG: alpha/beta fold hydrolase [Candidatus Portnoybacteria bacterium]|nr:alpha/beta fold hydrolase [Candidatus Portnoybacteria bacterium]